MSICKRKGGRWCSAPNCRNNSNTNKDISFFSFPKDEQRAREWALHSRREDLLKKNATYLNKNCTICSVHFEKMMFLNFLRNRLKPDAVPTLFNIPNPLVQGLQERRVSTERQNETYQISDSDVQETVQQAFLVGDEEQTNIKEEVTAIPLPNVQDERLSSRETVQQGFLAGDGEITNIKEEVTATPLPNVEDEPLSSDTFLNDVKEEPHSEEDEPGETFPQESLSETLLEARKMRDAHICSICGKKHGSNHSRSGPQKCKICGKSINNKNHFKSHTLWHSRDQPYRCEICERAFTKEAYLERHTKKHSCSVLGKTFNLEHHAK
ncbi:zinc finger and BTB domain-containing protein 14 [Anabrus simplex]|uniref:zinc finger and BTB domain-containing protein 14 n=1 Tax=Anabrus simplex TaxID=316456 RepID=UPI0035A305C8